MKILFSFIFIALAGLLTACQVQEVETAYTLADAVATIDVNVVDVSTGTTPDSDSFTVTASEGTVSSDGATVTITGNPALSKTDVTITVQYNNKEYSETVHINAVLTGGTASYFVTILVGEISVGDFYSVTVSYTGPDTEYEYVYSDEGDYSFTENYNGVDIDSWYLNAGSTFSVVPVDFIVKTGSTVDDLSISNQDYEVTINTIYEAYDSYKTVDVSTNFVISAYCYYNILVTYKLEYYDYDVNLVDDSGSVVETIATFTKCTYSTSIEAVEFSFDGRYGYGHGDGYNNAGGGIIISE